MKPGLPLADTRLCARRPQIRGPLSGGTLKTVISMACGGLLLAASSLLPVVAPSSVAQASPLVPLKEPREVDSLTSETTTVTEFPNGTFEATTFRDPVRVKKNGHWTPVDTTLEETTRGRFAPKATNAAITFSSGGDNPLVAYSTGDDQMSLHWESELPTPHVLHNQLTYPDVRPDTDLVMTATPTGYQQTLVIKTPEAAAALVADPVEVSATSDSFDFRATPDGGAVSRSEDGSTIATAPAYMWDSSGPERPSAASSAQAKVHPVDANVKVTPTRLRWSLAPSETIATAADTKYPLFLDPELNRSRNHFRTVNSTNTWNYGSNSDVMRVGFCDWPECNNKQGYARSYFSFDISFLNHFTLRPTVTKASVQVKQVHNASSAATPVQLHRAGSFTNTTTFPGPLGTHLETQSSNAGASGVPDGNILFDANEITTYIANKVDAHDNNLYFALRAANESNRLQWKKFDNNPTLTFKYGYPPTTPSLGAYGALSCPNQPDYLPKNPTLTAVSYGQAHSAQLPIQMKWEMYEPGIRLLPDHVDNSGLYTGYTSLRTPGTLTDGTYAYRAQAVTLDPSAPNYSSPWSPYKTVVVDTTAPAAPEVISNTHPPLGAPGAATNKETIFKPFSNGSAGYSWSISGGSDPASLPLVGFNECNYNRTSGDKLSGITTGPIHVEGGTLQPGPYTLTVSAFDHAHNPSAATYYKFYVSPIVDPAAGANVVEFEAMTARPGPGVDVSNIDHWSSSGNVGSGTHGQVSQVSAASASTSVVADYDFQVPASGYQALGIRYMGIPGGSRFKVSVIDPGGDGVFQSEVVASTDDYTYAVNAGIEPVAIDTHAPSAGTYQNQFRAIADYLPIQGVLMDKKKSYRLRIEILSTSTGSVPLLWLDALVAAPTRGPDYQSLTETFDNQAFGRTSGAPSFDLTTGGTLSFDADDRPASGSSYTVDGVTFTIPSRREVKNSSNQSWMADNVVSLGQTIKTTPETGTSGKHVYLLASATCGPINAENSRSLTATPDEPNANGVFPTRDIKIRTVPDWLESGSIPLPPGTSWVAGKRTFGSYSDAGSQVLGDASLFVLKLPLWSNNQVDSDEVDREIRSITLPRTGSTFNNAPCGQPGSQALHVFAMKIA